MAWSEPFVYFGTSEFSSQVLEGLLSAGCRPQLVVTTKPKPAGRGLGTVPTPVARLAGGAGLAVLEVSTLQPPLPPELLRSGVTFGVLAAFGRILPAELLGLYPRGIVNVHPSLLPKYRGPAPIQFALKDGVLETGLSLIILDKEIDHGPLLAQQTIEVQGKDDVLQLSERLAHVATELLMATLPRYLAGELSPTPQDHAQATFTRLVKREDGEANFNKSAQELNRQRRAFTPWPGLWTTWQGKRLKLMNTSVRTAPVLAPGEVRELGDTTVVGCAAGSLVLEIVQLQDSKPMSVREFGRGHSNFIGSQLPS